MLAKAIKKLNQRMMLSVAHQLVTAVYGFVLLLVLYRTTSKAEIGRWLLISTGISLVDMLMHGFLQTPVIRKLTTEKSDSQTVNRIASNAFLFAIGIWASATVLIFISSYIFGGVQMIQDMRWYLFLGLAMVFYNVCWWVGNALSDFSAVLMQRLIFVAVSATIITFTLFQKGRIPIENIIISQVVGYAVSSLIAILFIRKIKLSAKLYDREYINYFFSYGKFTSGSMVMGSLLRNADILMIAIFINQNAVAVYSAAQKTVEIFEVALRGMASHSLPDFCKSADNFPVLLKKYVSNTTMLLLFFLPLAFTMFIFSEKIIQMLSGSATAYSSASIVLKVFMAYVLFLVVDRMTGVTLEALGLARFNLIKTIMLVVVNVIGNAIALYFFHSLAGVALVSIIATATGIVSGVYFIMLHTGFSFSTRTIRYGFDLILKQCPNLSTSLK